MDQDGSDAATFKKHFGRSTFKNPCTYDNPCYGDFDKDADADGSDAAKFKEDFGRSGFSKACPQCKRPIGVIFTVHGGQVTNINEFTWNTGVQQFSYDPNNSVYKLAIWNPAYWDFVLQAESSLKFLGKFEFEYPQIGGIDPFPALTDEQFADMKTALDANTKGLNFEVDWAAWMCGDCVDHYAAPATVLGQGLPTSQPNFLRIIREEVKPGRQADHAKIEAGWPAAFAKAKSPDYYLAMVSMTGPQVVWFVSPWDSYTTWGNSMARDEANAELSAELARLSAVDAEHVESLPSLEAMARPDLSHGNYPDLNKQRFWEITIMRVRPGHDDQFAAAAKAYKAMAARSMPNARWRVYEVSAGMPGPTYLIFSSGRA